MKSFFKKIGRALKKGFQKIGKFFNSKIGKIMGGVLLAWNLGGIFANLFKLTGKAGAAAAANAAKLSGQVVTASGETVANIANQTVQSAGKEITQEATKKAVAQAASKSATKQVLINSIDDIAVVGSNLMANSGKVVAGTISEGSQALSTALETQGTKVLTSTPSEISTKAIEKQVDNLIFDTPDQVFPVSDRIIETGKLSPNITPETLDAALKGTTDAAQNNQLAFIRQEQNLPTNVFGTETPLTTQQLNAQTAWSQSTPAMKQEYFATSANRQLYTQNFEGLTSTFKAPAEYGAREFSNLGEAFTGGKNLLESTANLGKHVMETSIGELSGGRVGGFLGRRGAAGTAYTTASTAASLLAEPPEQPYTPNYQARSVARELGQAGEAIAMQPLAQGPAAMYGQVDFTSPDYYKQIMQINNNAGMSYAYGGGGINAGRYG